MLIYFLFTNATCSVFGFGKQVTYEINMPLEMIYIITLVLTSIVIVIKVRRRKNERKDILQRNLLIKKDLENKSYLLLTDSIKRACEQVEYTEDGDYTSYYYTTVCESIDTIRDNRLIEPYLDENNERIKVFRQMREFCTTKEHFKTLKEGAISYYLVGMSSGCCSHAIK